LFFCFICLFVENELTLLGPLLRLFNYLVGANNAAHQSNDARALSVQAVPQQRALALYLSNSLKVLPKLQRWNRPLQMRGLASRAAQDGRRAVTTLRAIVL
jgi:hypothetical protein